MSKRDHITILGGGPAGLATGYYARKRGIPFTIYEAKHRIGGNAITIQHGDFRFDSGAHRFHDVDPEVTREVKELLGSELLEMELTSHIYYEGKFIDFPLSPFNLLRRLSLPTLIRAAMDLILARINSHSDNVNFEQAAVGMYGRAIAERFLLNYSEKLWGLPCDSLSENISGTRLERITLSTLWREILTLYKNKPAHLEGNFYYPQMGYGTIVETLARVCGDDNIHVNSPIKAIHHNHSRIESLSISGEENLYVEEVVNTIPLPLFLSIMKPQPPLEYLNMTDSMRFRNLIVVAIFFDQERITHSASVYFPGKDFPFTRIHEPANRSRRMAPPGKTSLCVEYPCFSTDETWRLEKDELIDLTCWHLEKIGLINRAKVLGGEVIKLGHAYPILELGVEYKIQRLLDYLSGFSNLRAIGRNGRFVYTSVHDMLRFGLDIIDDLSKEEKVTSPSGSFVSLERDGVNNPL